jgi:SAM-dependent methyltransferase
MSKRTVAAPTESTCIICGEPTHPLHDLEESVIYDVCAACGFIYKQPEYHLSPTEEHQEYIGRAHEDNIAYITYLNSVINTSIVPLEGVQTILDFGSGPKPLLTELLLRRGYHVDHYDPFFQDNPIYLGKTYDLIIMNEVLAHVHRPMPTLEHLIEHLAEGGRLLILTQFRTVDDMDFSSWWYKEDPTHVGFYQDTTFVTIATILGLSIETNNHIDRLILTR